MNVSCKWRVFGMYCLISFPLFSQGVYLELNLNDPAAQNGIGFVRPKPPLEVFRVIEKAANDNKIRGILLNIGSFSGSGEYLWELRNTLEQFKSSGKKICAFISSADIDVYCLASVADKIVMDEQGSLSLLGYAWGRGYVKHSLEKLGIGVRELRYLEYKSAAETFTRDSLSEADRIQYGEYLDDIFNITRNTIMNARNMTGEEFDTVLNREFLYSAKSAQSRNLVDSIGRRDVVTKTIREIEGTEVKNFVLYGDSVSSLTDSRANYSLPRTGGFFRRPPIIAVVYASGQTDMDSGMSARSLSQTIRELSETKRVKAIVLRINSPGGSAEAADYVDEAVRYAKQKVPVVVSMGQVAASGGYWAAMNANHIIATPYTITGSIGVIGNWFYDNGLNAKLGVSVDSIQRGMHADLLTGAILPRRDLSTEEEERFKNLLLDMYGDFVAKAAAGREMEIEKIEAAAQGRVYSGTKALETGLIDSIGGLSDALRTARELAKIPEDKAVLYAEYPKPKFWDKLIDRVLSTAAVSENTGVQAGTAAFFAELLLPQPLLTDIRYRIEHNGQVMPILPLDFSFSQ